MKLRCHFILPAIALALHALSPRAAPAQIMKWDDVNGDGIVGAVDGHAILSAVVGAPLPAGFTAANGDANCDGTLGP